MELYGRFHGVDSREANPLCVLVASLPPSASCQRHIHVHVYACILVCLWERSHMMQVWITGMRGVRSKPKCPLDPSEGGGIPHRYIITFLI